MSQLLLRGCRIEDYTGYCSTSGQGTIEIKLRAAWTDTVAREMGWAEEPTGFGNGNLEGGLNGISMILEPNKKDLKDYRLDIKISKVYKFKHRAKTEGGDVVTRELECVVTTNEEGVVSYIEQYVCRCGPGDDRGQCKIVFNAEEQMKIEGTEPAAEEKTRGRRKESAAVAE